jgi:hypothetical protein
MTDSESILATLDSLVGDVPVSSQLGLALERMAEKEHSHDIYALCSEVEELKRKISVLIDLVGDMPVSEQINLAINNIK